MRAPGGVLCATVFLAFTTAASITSTFAGGVEQRQREEHTNEKQSRGKETEMSTSLFGLNGDDFWKEPWKTSAELHQRYVRESVFGLYIDGPPEVMVGAHDRIPVPFLYVASQREAFVTDLPQVAKVVVARAEDHTVMIANAITPRDKRLPPPKVGKDSDDPTSEKHIVDLETQLHLLREPGTYRVVVLVKDKASNRIEVRVTKPKTEHQDQEVNKFLDSYRVPKAIPPPPSPSKELLWTPTDSGPKPLPDSPAVPAQDGIAMTVERVILNVADSRAILRGSFKLPVLKSELVPPPPPPRPLIDPVAAAKVDVAAIPPPLPDPYGEPRATAILPVTLVILGSVSTSHIVIRLQVPVWQEFDAKAEIFFATGHFAIDLFANRNLRITPQTFSIYAFGGGEMSGPVLMATVTEDMLPKPGE